MNFHFPMKYKLSLLFIWMMGLMSYGQQPAHAWPRKFVSVAGGVGVDGGWIANLILNNEHRAELGRFTYSLTAQAGYRLTKRWAISTGGQYAYVTPNFHPIFWKTNALLLLGDTTDQQYNYLSFSYGKQMNSSSGKAISVIGFSFGTGEIINNKIGHNVNLFLDLYTVDNPVLMVGAEYRVMLFSKR